MVRYNLTHGCLVTMSSLKDHLVPCFPSTSHSFHALMSFLKTLSLNLVLGLPLELGFVLKRAFLGVLESSLCLTWPSHLRYRLQRLLHTETVGHSHMLKYKMLLRKTGVSKA